MVSPERESAGARWRKPSAGAPGVLRYIETVRERIWLVLGIAALTLAVAVVYLEFADKTYEAQSELLVTPISEDDAALTGLALIRASSDPTRDVETVARLVTSRDVAVRVKRELGLKESVEDLAERVDAAPVAQSNLVVITASDKESQEAAELANSFASNAIEDRSSKLRVQLTPLITGLEERIASSADSPTVQIVSLENQLARLESLDAGGDPTIRIEAAAAAPQDPASPRPALTLVAGLIGGLVLGVGAAFLTRSIDPRLRREEQLRELYGLPILARVPKERKRIESGLRLIRRELRKAPLKPSALSPATLEAYRTLRTMLSTSVPAQGAMSAEGKTIMITGASPVEGKTTTAINLAASYALAGKRVILIEADFRRPTIAAAFRVEPQVGIGDVMIGESSFENALVRIDPFGALLRVLPVKRADGHLSELLSMPAARKLLDEARVAADYVIVDSPPLTEVVDALPLAHQVDDLLLVCRIGMSSISQLARLADLLEENEIEPRGFVLVGVHSSPEGGYYLREAKNRRGFSPRADMSSSEKRTRGGRVAKG